MADFDLIILGAGPGGYTCAHRALALGLTVAVVDPGPPGGVCLNHGCIPTKGLLNGPHPDGFSHRVAENAAAIARLRRGVESFMKGATRITGAGRLTGPGSVHVDGHGPITAEHIVIATGSKPVALPKLPFDGTSVLSSDHALGLERAPETLAIVGAGAVGLEFADIFHAYGTRVTVIEAKDRLLPEMDPWFAKHVGRAFKQKGIAVRTGAKVIGAHGGEGSAMLKVSGADGDDILETAAVLVAIGRRPDPSDLGLETVGVDAPGGIIPVAENCRTAAPGVWAIGDATGPPQLAHRAMAMGEIVAEAIAGRNPLPLAAQRIPYCVYIHPQAAAVGRGPEEGMKTSEATFQGDGLAVVTGHTEGGVRLIADAGRIVGAQMVGHGVTEWAGLLDALIDAGVTADALGNAIFPHPTMSETVRRAARGLEGG